MGQSVIVNMNLKLLLVDEHPMLRYGLRQAVSLRADVSVCGEVGTGTLAIQQALELTPEIIVMEILLPDLNGAEVIRRIHAALPAAKIIIFSSQASRTLVDAALQAGAGAYVLKRGEVSELIKAIDLVLAGKMYLSPDLSAGIVEDYRRSLSGEPAHLKPVLTDREQYMLRLVAEGRRNKEIACHLTVSTKSVESYRSRLMKKLDCSSAAELVRYAIREGIAAA